MMNEIQVKQREKYGLLVSDIDIGVPGSPVSGRHDSGGHVEGVSRLVWCSSRGKQDGGSWKEE